MYQQHIRFVVKIVHDSTEGKSIDKELEKLRRKVGLDEINFSTSFLPEIREIVRLAIKEFVDSEKSKEEITQRIDDAFLE